MSKELTPKEEEKRRQSVIDHNRKAEARAAKAEKDRLKQNMANKAERQRKFKKEKENTSKAIRQAAASFQKLTSLDDHEALVLALAVHDGKIPGVSLKVGR